MCVMYVMWHSSIVYIFFWLHKKEEKNLDSAKRGRREKRHRERHTERWKDRHTGRTQQLFGILSKSNGLFPFTIAPIFLFRHV